MFHPPSMSRVILIALAVCLMMAAAFAQPGRGGRFGRAGGEFGQPAGPDARFGDGRMLLRLLRGLELSEAQQQTVRQLVAAQAEELAQLTGDRNSAQRRLQTAVRSTPLDELRVRQASAALAAARLSIQQVHAQMFAAVWAVLDADQQDRLRDRLERAEDRAGRPGRGPGSGEPDVWRMTRRLGLNPEQQTLIQTILDSHRDTLETLRANDRDAHRAVQAAVRQPAHTPAAVAAASVAHAQVRLALALERHQVFVAILEVLTPEQREQFETRRPDAGFRGLDKPKAGSRGFRGRGRS